MRLPCLRACCLPLPCACCCRFLGAVSWHLPAPLPFIALSCVCVGLLPVDCQKHIVLSCSVGSSTSAVCGLLCTWPLLLPIRPLLVFWRLGSPFPSCPADFERLKVSSSPFHFFCCCRCVPPPLCCPLERIFIYTRSNATGHDGVLRGRIVGNASCGNKEGASRFIQRGQSREKLSRSRLSCGAVQKGWGAGRGRPACLPAQCVCASLLLGSRAGRGL